MVGLDWIGSGVAFDVTYVTALRPIGRNPVTVVGLSQVLMTNASLSLRHH